MRTIQIIYVCICIIGITPILQIGAQNTPTKQLLQAATLGDQQHVQHFLDTGINPNAHNAAGITALHRAAANGQFYTVELLLQHPNIMVDKRDNMRETPLHKAAQQGHFYAAEFLIEYGANVNAQSEWRLTPLHLACRNNHFSVVQLLASQNSIDINKPDNIGLTPLHKAARYADQQIVHYLLKKGADPNIKSSWGLTPLHIAAKYNTPQTVETLIQYGAHVRAISTIRKTALGMALFNQKIANTYRILAYGALTDINEMRYNPFTRAIITDMQTGDIDTLIIEAKKRAINQTNANDDIVAYAQAALGQRHTHTAQGLFNYLQQQQYIDQTSIAKILLHGMILHKLYPDRYNLYDFIYRNITTVPSTFKIIENMIRDETVIMKSELQSKLLKLFKELLETFNAMKQQYNLYQQESQRLSDIAIQFND